VLVYTPTDSPTTPCGACRQVIAEFSPDTRIVCTCDGSDILELSLNELLPHQFGAHSLD
jgi:cytidine deaminase